jgi:hypothetical protein
MDMDMELGVIEETVKGGDSVTINETVTPTMATLVDAKCRNVIAGHTVNPLTAPFDNSFGESASFCVDV